MPRRLTVAVVAVVVLAVAGTAVAQTAQRFSDVPPDHEAAEAVEWAAETGLTLGYEDGTFRPDEPLPRWAALVFMERFYDDVLEAAESEGFTRGDMMVLLKAINDSTPPPSGSTEPETFGEYRAGQGRCAPAVVMGVYDWEHCAWGVTDDPEMGQTAMRELVARIWTEMDHHGKPDRAPLVEEGDCPGANTLGCYLPHAHTIRLETGFTLSTLLHELAHALVIDDPGFDECGEDWNDWAHLRPTCWHGDVFRCAADALYVRYGDTTAAGVCGADSTIDAGGWRVEPATLLNWAENLAEVVLWDTNTSETRRWHRYRLFVRCVLDYSTEERRLDVLLNHPYGAIGVTIDPVQVQWWYDKESRPSRYAPIDSYRRGQASDNFLFWSPAVGAEFVSGFPSATTLRIQILGPDGNVQRAAFDLGDSPGLAIVRSACN